MRDGKAAVADGQDHVLDRAIAPADCDCMLVAHIRVGEYARERDRVVFEDHRLIHRQAGNLRSSWGRAGSFAQPDETDFVVLALDLRGIGDDRTIRVPAAVGRTAATRVFGGNADYVKVVERDVRLNQSLRTVIVEVKLRVVFVAIGIVIDSQETDGRFRRLKRGNTCRGFTGKPADDSANRSHCVGDSFILKCAWVVGPGSIEVVQDKVAVIAVEI